MPVRLNLRRLEGEVTEIESQPVNTGRIIFYGDSFFTRWRSSWGNIPLEDAIGGTANRDQFLNHGFGSSTAEDLLYYYPRLILPYRPKGLVIHIGANDLLLYHYAPSEVMELVSRIVAYARTDFPGIRFVLCGPHGDYGPYSTTRGALIALPEYAQLLREFCARYDDCRFSTFMDNPAFFPSEDAVGSYTDLRPELYIDDHIHFNAFGYTLWAEQLRGEFSDITGISCE